MEISNNQMKKNNKCIKTNVKKQPNYMKTRRNAFENWVLTCEYGEALPDYMERQHACHCDLNEAEMYFNGDGDIKGVIKG